MISFREYINEADAPKKRGGLPWGAAAGAGIAYAGANIARGYLKSKYGLHIPDGGMGDAVIAAGGAAIGGVAQRVLSGTRRTKSQPVKDPENWRKNPPQKLPGRGDSMPKDLPPLPTGPRTPAEVVWGRRRGFKKPTERPSHLPDPKPMKESKETSQDVWDNGKFLGKIKYLGNGKWQTQHVDPRAKSVITTSMNDAKAKFLPYQGEPK